MISIECDKQLCDVMIALLENIGYDGFEETGQILHAYISEDKFSVNELNKILSLYSLTATISIIEKKNWNEEWEKNFQPVVVENFCTIRADFHDVKVYTPYEIIITPKMSFGTGHHATTQLMMEAMSKIDFEGACVLDFGTGTGILGILGSMLGAKDVVGVDNEEWACENARENITKNRITNFEVLEGSLEILTEQKFDIILANINRHILLQYMNSVYEKLLSNGIVLMSGVLNDDEEIIVTAALKTGFNISSTQSKNNWLQITLTKQSIQATI